jgi:hypothetical protein
MKPKIEPNIGALAVIGVDIRKEVFHLVGLDVDGKIASRKKIRRLGLKDAFEKLPPCIVGMEACLSAHFVRRVLRVLGHEPPRDERPTRSSQTQSCDPRKTSAIWLQRHPAQYLPY